MSAMNQHQQNKASLLERLIFNNRPAVIFICLLVSVFLFYQATQVRPSRPGSRAKQDQGVSTASTAS